MKGGHALGHNAFRLLMHSTLSPTGLHVDSTCLIDIKNATPIPYQYETFRCLIPWTPHLPPHTTV